MWKYTFLLVASLLLARDNPFVAAIKTSNTSSILPHTKEFFKQASVSLPSDARVVKEVRITYQSLNGGLYSEKIELDKKVDWHNPFIITHQAKKIVIKQNKKIKSKKRPQKYVNKVLKPFKFLALKSENNTLQLITKDKLVRSFTVPKPYKIVLDFKRETHFNKKRIKALNLPFKSFFFGEHRGYYRLVITLDGFYKFKVKKSNDGYRLKLL